MWHCQRFFLLIVHFVIIYLSPRVFLYSKRSALNGCLFILIFSRNYRLSLIPWCFIVLSLLFMFSLVRGKWCVSSPPFTNSQTHPQWIYYDGYRPLSYQILNSFHHIKECVEGHHYSYLLFVTPFLFFLLSCLVIHSLIVV